MRRQPKGTFVHNAPSFELRNMASGGLVSGNIALGDSIAFGLYNDATDGRWIVLWDLKMHYSPFDGGGDIHLVNVGHLQGNNGNPLVAGSPLVALQPRLPGSTWIEHNFQDFTDDYLYLIGANGTFQWEHDWPLGAIPPNWSLVAIADGNAANRIGFNYIWEVVAQI